MAKLTDTGTNPNLLKIGGTMKIEPLDIYFEEKESEASADSIELIQRFNLCGELAKQLVEAIYEACWIKEIEVKDIMSANDLVYNVPDMDTIISLFEEYGVNQKVLFDHIRFSGEFDDDTLHVQEALSLWIPINEVYKRLDTPMPLQRITVYTFVDKQALLLSSGIPEKLWRQLLYNEFYNDNFTFSSRRVKR